VSITEDATMSRTRSEGGATVVREEAITKLPASSQPVEVPWGEILCFPCPPLAENRAELRGSQLNLQEKTEVAHKEIFMPCARRPRYGRETDGFRQAVCFHDARQRAACR
jgi:hypothetical protein